MDTRLFQERLYINLMPSIRAYERSEYAHTRHTSEVSIVAHVHTHVCTQRRTYEQVSIVARVHTHVCVHKGGHTSK